jgi:hypothetical protein
MHVEFIINQKNVNHVKNINKARIVINAHLQKQKNAILNKLKIILNGITVND